MIVERQLFDIAVVIEQLQAGMNVFQRMLLDFIVTVDADLSLEEQLQVAMAAAAFDYETIVFGRFSDAFSRIVFSEDIALNNRLHAWVDDDRFAALDAVVAVIMTAQVENPLFNVALMDTTALFEFTAEFLASGASDISTATLRDLALAVAGDDQGRVRNKKIWSPSTY